MQFISLLYKDDSTVLLWFYLAFDIKFAGMCDGSLHRNLNVREEEGMQKLEMRYVNILIHPQNCWWAIKALIWGAQHLINFT